MRARAEELAIAVGGTLHGPDVDVVNASIDSRVVHGGELFVPVPAERDGHDFIEDALKAGASAYLTARGARSGTAIAVPDTIAALAALGRWARARLPDRVVGITGSVGKTSTKDLLAAILRRSGPVAASDRSHNNELGVPLTLFNASADTDVTVVEMGARGAGHISQLCALAGPTVGIVTNVGLAHISLFGTIDDVARAKRELPAALPAGGTAVLNADDERVVAMSEGTAASVLTFGTDAGDVRAARIALDAELRPSFQLMTPWGEVTVELHAHGLHQVPNALAAAAAALALDADLADVAAGLKEAVVSPWRMELTRTRRGTTVVNDAYNANPQSTEAALRALASLDAHRHIAVLGPMLELGDVSVREHRRIGALARSLGVSVISVDAPDYGGDDVAGIDGALERLRHVGRGDVVLVKASRAAGLERVAEALLSDDNELGEEPAWSRS
jgi:UDP-N-acetylmuramoyl-tripeptide--D-alanyl-D-alanine ligase